MTRDWLIMLSRGAGPPGGRGGKVLGKQGGGEEQATRDVGAINMEEIKEKTCLKVFGIPPSEYWALDKHLSTKIYVT